MPVSAGPYILIAPYAAVIVIWLIASTFGSQRSVERMCLFPKSVQPLKPYLRHEVGERVTRARARGHGGGTRTRGA